MEWCTVGSLHASKPHAESSSGKRMNLKFRDCDCILLIKFVQEKQTITVHC